ncbi:LEF-4 [Carcinus maenas nudivirus]|uniref:LEF-4 n=1 Tax=Carcinus maenas nudivirus TaxID=2880837 RepID=A0AAE8Y0C0_9VIRU|nr:LEF-4 [Carcinus maenas nudivirus]UBZ25671.1 LEF-4 [Carcinus maenas nudivirus]
MVAVEPKKKPMLIVKEYETSINMQISKTIYSKLLNDSNIEESYLIIYFSDNIRMSKDRVESKIIQKCKAFMKIIYYNDDVYMIPYTRTESIECSSALPNLQEAKTFIHRKIINKFKLSGKYDMRIALEERCDSQGSSYALTSEVEYNQLDFRYYAYNKAIEDEFFANFVDVCMYYIEDIKLTDIFKFDPNNIMNYGSRVFQPLNSTYTTPQKEKFVHKFDGYKCKIGIRKGVVIFYDAKHNYRSGYCTALNKFENVVFQAEILGDSLVIVDILGGFKNNNRKNLHMPQPLEVLEFFKWFRDCELPRLSLKEPFDLVLTNQGHQKKIFKVYTQYEVDPTNITPTQFPTDGYIIFERGNLHKYKIPTIDVVVECGYLKVSGKLQPITDQLFTKLDENVVYEVQQKPDGCSYKIMKIRYDKQTPSTAEEYAEYIKELEFFRKGIRASKSVTCKKNLDTINQKLQQQK